MFSKKINIDTFFCKMNYLRERQMVCCDAFNDSLFFTCPSFLSLFVPQAKFRYMYIFTFYYFHWFINNFIWCSVLLFILFINLLFILFISFVIYFIYHFFIYFIDHFFYLFYLSVLLFISHRKMIVKHTTLTSIISYVLISNK